MTLIWWPIVGLGAVLGAVAGSFATTAGLRFARGEQALFGRSYCDGCGQALSFGRTTPVVSYVVLRGRAACCGTRIDPGHGLGELAGAIMGGVIAALDAPPLRTGLLALLAATLIALSAVDAKTRRLPDALTGLAALVCLSLALMDSPDGLWLGLGAALATLAVLALVRKASMLRRGDPGLGLGDVKLLSALALWLGVLTPWALAASAAVGLAGFVLVRPKDGRLPFGPAIAAGAWCVGIGKEAGLWSMSL